MTFQRHIPTRSNTLFPTGSNATKSMAQRVGDTLLYPKGYISGPPSGAGPDIHGDLAALARQVERLSPCHRDPERFHLDKSVIAETLRRMAGQVRNG
jgi:hypothetical protein